MVLARCGSSTSPDAPAARLASDPLSSVPAGIKGRGEYVRLMFEGESRVAWWAAVRTCSHALRPVLLQASSTACALSPDMLCYLAADAGVPYVDAGVEQGKK